MDSQARPSAPLTGCFVSELHLSRLYAEVDRHLLVLSFSREQVTVIDIDHRPKRIITNHLAAVADTERGMHLYYEPCIAGPNLGDSFTQSIGADRAYWNIGQLRGLYCVRIVNRDRRSPRRPPRVWLGPGATRKSIDLGSEIVSAWRWALCELGA